MSSQVNFKLAPPNRVSRMRQALAEANIDILVCCTPQSVFQFSNFNPVIQSSPTFVILAHRKGNEDVELFLLVHGLREPLALDTPGLPRTYTYGNWLGQSKGSFWAGATWQEALAALLKDRELKNIGVEPHEFASIGGFDLPGATFVDARALINRCRSIKDPDQIEAAYASADLVAASFHAAQQAFSDPASTGIDLFVAAKIGGLKRFQQLSRTQPSIKICGFGPQRGCLLDDLAVWALPGPERFYNCGAPTSRKSQDNELTSLGFVFAVNGIHVEQERSVWRGTLSEFEQQALVDLHEIRKKIMAEIKPNVARNKLYEIYRAEMVQRGYGDYLVFRIGHDIGLDQHEPVSLDAENDAKLVPGTMFTLEPHIIIPGKCRTQISDTLVMTETGSVNLTFNRDDAKFDDWVVQRLKEQAESTTERNS